VVLFRNNNAIKLHQVSEIFFTPLMSGINIPAPRSFSEIERSK